MLRDQRTPGFGFNPVGLALGFTTAFVVYFALDNFVWGLAVGVGAGLLFSLILGARDQRQ